MTDKHVPDGYHTVTPYLHVSGADRLIDFLKQAFEAEELNRTTGDDGRIRHAEIRLEGSILECSESGGPYSPMPCAIHLFVRDADKCYERAMAAGAASLYGPEDMPYGERSAGVKDPFGNHWYIATYLGTSS